MLKLQNLAQRRYKTLRKTLLVKTLCVELNCDLISKDTYGLCLRLKRTAIAAKVGAPLTNHYCRQIASKTHSFYPEAE